MAEGEILRRARAARWARSMAEGEILRRAKQRLENLKRVTRGLEDCRRQESEEKEREIQKEVQKLVLRSAKICMEGVCKWMTWDEAKEHIVSKHGEGKEEEGERYWREWIHRVSWRDNILAEPDASLNATKLIMTTQPNINNHILAEPDAIETPTKLIMTTQPNINNQTSVRKRKRRDAFKRCLTDAPFREILSSLIVGVTFSLLGLALCWMIHR
jgi:hypothetical protein